MLGATAVDSFNVSSSSIPGPRMLGAGLGEAYPVVRIAENQPRCRSGCCATTDTSTSARTPTPAQWEHAPRPVEAVRARPATTSS